MGMMSPEIAKIIKDKLKQKEWDKKGFPPELIRKKWHYKQIINIVIDNISKKGKIYQKLMCLRKGKKLTMPKNRITINAMEKVSDKKSRWSKKQIIGIIADDIEKSGKLGKLIIQTLNPKKKEVIKA